MFKTSKEYLLDSFEEIMCGASCMDIGKLLQFVSPIVHKYWLINNGIKCDVIYKKGENDDDHLPYDLKINDLVLGQSKYRGAKNKSGTPKLHFENTRRISKKNEGSSKTGHVPYSLDEFDVVIFNIPGDPKNPNTWEQLAIPNYELEDPNNLGYLRASIPKKIFNKYKGKALETIISLIRKLEN